jgi:hypothetical protein
LDHFIVYYVDTAENNCAGNLETHIWARREDDGRVAKWRAAEWRAAEWRILRGARRRMASMSLKIRDDEEKD